MWKEIKAKYMHTFFATGIAGIWGILMGKDDWTTLFVGLKDQVAFSVFLAIIVAGVVVFVAGAIQKRREQIKDLERAHGK
jgi:uncharacterized membrane protein YeaQ/YmgE (transglycosylase-associated protein family)